MWRLNLKLSRNLKLVAIFIKLKNCITMANFNGKLTIEVTFENLNVPVGFGMTDAIIYHNCAEQIYLRSPWTKLDKKGIKANFKIQKTRNKVRW